MYATGGAVGIFVLLVNRLINMDIVTDVQSRADIISMIACSGLLLNALSEQDITARERDPVPLVGFSLRTPVVAPDVSATTSKAISWLSSAIIKNSPATSVHLINSTGIISQSGVVSTDPALGQLPLKPSRPILSSAISDSEEVYLPDLQILPGKIEFNYLPLNCQSVLILPVGSGLAVVVGTNQAKALKSDDLSKIRILVGIFQAVL
jgi:Cofactor assembly of complex C subunit B, CCB2/CCB4